MAQNPSQFAGFFHQEPAHPGVIRQHGELVDLYKILRGQYQEAIDAAFDRVSRQIGFVVVTTLPISVKVADKNVTLTMGAENLRGTLFEQAMMETFKGLPESLRAGKLADGTYNIYVIWYEALKLKLRGDWMEPAHPYWMEPAHPGQWAGGQVIQQARQRPVIGPGVQEPAHWFDASVALDVQEGLVISAIDQVYPELRLVDRIQAARQSFQQAFNPAVVTPGIREPAHFRDILARFDPATLEQVVQVIQAIQQMR
jgi:hypothetical protein